MQGSTNGRLPKSAGEDMDEYEDPTPPESPPPRFADVRELLERVCRTIASEYLIRAELLAREGE